MIDRTFAKANVLFIWVLVGEVFANKINQTIRKLYTVAASKGAVKLVRQAAIQLISNTAIRFTFFLHMHCYFMKVRKIVDNNAGILLTDSANTLPMHVSVSLGGRRIVVEFVENRTDAFRTSVLFGQISSLSSFSGLVNDTALFSSN